MIVVDGWYGIAKIGGLMNDGSPVSRSAHRIRIRIRVGSGSVTSQSAASLVLALGAIGQLVDSRTYPSHAVSTEIHVLFGLLLCAVVFTHFYNAMKQAPSAAPDDIARFSRNLSRRIYLLLYVLLGLRFVMQLDRPQAPEGFRDYLLDGVLALVLVRILATRWQRVADLTPSLASRPSVESL